MTDIKTRIETARASKEQADELFVETTDKLIVAIERLLEELEIIDLNTVDITIEDGERFYRFSTKQESGMDSRFRLHIDGARAKIEREILAKFASEYLEKIAEKYEAATERTVALINRADGALKQI